MSEPQYVQALYDYAGGEGKLAFRSGDIIRVIPQAGSGAVGWDSGEAHGVMGWYPSAYVQPYTMPAREPEPQYDEEENDASIETPVADSADEGDDREVIVIYNDRQAFVDKFWEERFKDGAVGIDVIFEYIHQGVEAVKNVMAVFTHKASMDAYYARESAAFATMDMQAALKHSVETPLKTLLQEFGREQKQMNDRASFFYTQIIPPLEACLAETESVIKKHSDVRDADADAMAKQEKECEKLRLAAFDLCRKAAAQKTQADTQKIRRKAEASQHVYKEAVEEYNSLMQVRNDHNVEAMEEFEVRAKAHITSIRAALEACVPAYREAIAGMANILEGLLEKVQQISDTSDVDQFITENQTGPRRPALMKVQVWDPTNDVKNKKKK